MKEFVDKLIKQLEERIEENVGWEDDEFFDGQSNAFEWTISVINKLVEKYNNGWIPCSERLPKEANDYLVTQYNRDAIDEYCNGSRISKIFFDVEWWDDIDHECGWDIIAWQPLPKPYKE